MRLFSNLVLCCCCVLIISCDKSEGTGGTSKISGKLYSINFKDESSLYPDTTLAIEEDVYIKYGNDSEISEKCVTDENGEYFFNYLRPGNYSILTFAKIRGTEIDTAIIHKVEIKDKKSNIRIDDMYLYKAKTGYATISGRVFVKDYNTLMKPKSPEDNYYIGGEDVYIQKIGAVDVLDKEETSSDGRFLFRHLTIGNYKIYTYSNDTTELPGSNGNDFSSRRIPVTIECRIDSINQKIELSDFVIIK